MPNPRASAAPEDAAPTLGSYLETPVRLFIADGHLLKQIAGALNSLGFKDVGIIKASSNYFQSMQQLFGVLMSLDGLLLVNHPPQRVRDERGQQTEDMCFADFYGGVSGLLAKTRKEPAQVLAGCVPVFYAPQDHDIRARTLGDLFPFGILGAFMLRLPDLNSSLQKQIEEAAGDLSEYLLEYFLQRDQKLMEFKEYKSAAELKNRREEAEKLMQEVERLKQAKDFDRAIALCRQAIEVLPTEPEAYLESGRLLVKKRRYPPAMQMFRDAEGVARELPGPNEEIANLRVTQVKEYIADQKRNGREVDQAQVNAWMGEAVDSFQSALTKASNIRTMISDEREERRRGAVAAITEKMLTLDLEPYLGPGSPHLVSLGQLARDNLRSQTKDLESLPPSYIIRFGLLALYEGDFATAQTQFLKAARIPEVFQDACMKLNYLGTQLRQRDRLDEAITAYQKLLELKPSFRGTVLFNLAVARQSKANEYNAKGDPRGADMEQLAAGTTVEALYVDPRLPMDDNFYHNTVIYPSLKRLVEVFNLAREQNVCLDTTAEKLCLQARERLEGYLAQKDYKQALQFMFGLAGTLKPFFLNFERYASEPILLFAQQMEPKLAVNPKPHMQRFGKVLGILTKRGEKALSMRVDLDEPLVQQAVEAMMRMEQAIAAARLAQALFTRPDLVKEKEFCSNTNLMNLCHEVAQKLEGVRMEEFQARTARRS